MATEFRTDRNWLWVFAAYFAFHAVYRAFVGAGLGLDEAELVVTSQALDWGYGPQPPLYFWFQYGVFRLMGETVLAMALVKNVLLFLTYAALYRLLLTSFDRATAGLTTLALLLIPQIAWESQRALTHSVLSTCMVVVTVLGFWWLVRQRSISAYLLFGAMIAIGVLSKFNYVVLPAGVLLAALTLPETRGAVLDRRMLATFAVTAALLAKPVVWMLDNPDLVLASSGKFQFKETAPIWQSAFTGTFSFLVMTLSFVGVLLPILGWLFWRYRPEPHASFDPALLHRLMARTVLVAIVLTLLVVLGTGVTNVKDRWLQPVLLFAAPTLALLVLPQLTALGRKRYLQSVAVAALLVILVVPVHNLYGNTGRPAYRSAPFAGLVEAIKATAPQTRLIIANSNWMAANIRILAPDWVVVTPRYRALDVSGMKHVVLVWTAEKRKALQTLTEAYRVKFGKMPKLGAVQRHAAQYPLHETPLFEVRFVTAD